MTQADPSDSPHPLMWLLWLALFVGLPAAIAIHESHGRPAENMVRNLATHAARPSRAPPAVDPVRVYALKEDTARTINAAVPFSTLPNPPALPFFFGGDPAALARATDCLAAAQIYEAGDDATGERAVAQVVLNRVRHPAFPKTVCGVVFQGQERTTGCQFTFTCDGALARTPSPAAWERARMIAKAALAGAVFKPVGYATHYHTNWVVPYWSSSLNKVAAVGTHLFFRWAGWWGTPGAFRRTVDGIEPNIGRIARLSSAHLGGAGEPFVSTVLAGAAQMADRPVQAIGADSLGRSFGSSRLLAMAPGAKTFLLELSKSSTPDSWPVLAQTFCAGRDQCRIMAWKAGSGAPTGFPLGNDQLGSMIFSYIHDSNSGLQRALWNCAQSPRANKNECMRDRDAAASVERAGKDDTVPTLPPLSGVRRKERFETVTITPPTPPAIALPKP